MLPEVHDLSTYPMSDDEIASLHAELTADTGGQITQASLAGALQRWCENHDAGALGSHLDGGRAGSGLMAGGELKWVPLVSRASSVDEGMDLLFEVDPAAFFLHGPQIKQMLEYRVRAPSRRRSPTHLLLHSSSALPIAKQLATRSMRAHRRRVYANTCLHAYLCACLHAYLHAYLHVYLHACACPRSADGTSQTRIQLGEQRQQERQVAEYQDLHARGRRDAVRQRGAPCGSHQGAHQKGAQSDHHHGPRRRRHGALRTERLMTRELCVDMRE